MLGVKTSQENQEIKGAVEAAKRTANSNNSAKITELKNELVSLKEQIQSANKNGQDTSELISAMDSTINQLNSLGEATPYYHIYTDGKSTTFVETSTPTLTPIR